MLSVTALSKSYGHNIKTSVLKDLSFYLDISESMSIRGDSGSGKSTLLNILSALDVADKGSIELTVSNETKRLEDFNEREANHYRSHTLGLIFQSFNLIDCLSVEENILLPAKLKNNLDQTHIAKLTDVLGINKLLKRRTRQLSGGEQQRVAIARALSHKPNFIIADEPTGNLDSKNSELVANLLYQTCKQQQTALIIVTHSEKVAKLADKHFFLSEGKLTDVSS